MNGKSEITGHASTPPPLPASPLSCLFLSLSTSPCVDSCLRVHGTSQLRGSGDSLAPIGGFRDSVFLALCCFVFGERRPESSGAFLSVLYPSQRQSVWAREALRRERAEELQDSVLLQRARTLKRRRRLVEEVASGEA